MPSDNLTGMAWTHPPVWMQVAANQLFHTAASQILKSSICNQLINPVTLVN